MKRCPGYGPTPCRLMLISERPGQEEVARGKPFVGQAGKVLDWLLGDVGLDRRDMYITNVLKQLPKSGQKISQAEIDRDTPELLEEIARVNPEYILLAGQTAVRWWYGKGLELDRVHGLLPQAQTVRTPPPRFKAALPGRHPAAAIHDQDLIPEIRYDLSQFKRLMDGFSVTPPYDAITDPHYAAIIDPGQLQRLMKDVTHIAVDTEGWPWDPICLSFSMGGGYGFVIYAHMKEVVKEFEWLIRKHRPLVIVHNAMWDLSVLAAMGIYPERIMDTMVMCYLLGEPQSLKAVAYRKCGMVMDDYIDLVDPVTRERQIEFVRFLARFEYDKPEPLIITEKQRQKVKQPQGFGQYLKRLLADMAKNEELDIEDRWNKIHPNVLATADNPTLPIATLRDIPSDKVIPYAGRDADATLRLFSCLMPDIKKKGLEKTLEMDMGVIKMANRMQNNGMPANLEYFKKLSEELQHEMGGIRWKIRNLIGYTINPESHTQVADLLFNKLRLPSYKTTKSGANSTNEKAIESLRDKHPVVPLVLDHRELAKLDDSFCAVIINKSGQDPEGIVRGRINTTRVTSGRFSMVDPNLMAIPVRTENGLKIREGFEAPEGYLFGSWDLDQVEMRVMADESEDKELCGLFRSGADIHSITAARMFGLRDPRRKKDGGDVDDKLHRYPAKRVGFGVITGITGAGLLDQFRLNNLTRYDEDDCDRMIKEWFRMYQRVLRYMQWCRQCARRDGYIRDRWGRYRILEGIWSPIKKVVAEAERQSHSHRIQGGAQGMLKIAMAQQWELWPWMKAEFDAEPRLQIHDELIWTFKKEGWSTMNAAIKTSMKTAVRLRVPVEASGTYSTTWGGLK